MTEKRSIRRQVRILIGGVLGIPGLFIVLTFWADPLQIFHDQPLERPVFINDERAYAGTIQRHFFRRKDRRTAIGNCLVMNMTYEEAKTLGDIEEPLNLGLCSCKIGGICTLLQTLKESSCLKRVIVNLEGNTFCTPRRLSHVELAKGASFYVPYIRMLFRHFRIYNIWASFRYFREVEEILFRYLQIIPSPSPEKRGYWFNGACSSHAYTKEKGYLEEFRTDYERNKPELLDLKKFLDTHDLTAVNKRFNTTERCFTHLMEIFASMNQIQSISVFLPIMRSFGLIWTIKKNDILQEHVVVSRITSVGFFMY